MDYLVLVWVHVLAAVVWIGGMLFVGAILVPLARPMPPRDHAALLERVGVRFSVVGWTCIGVLLLTGPWLLLIRGRLEFLLQPSSLIGVPVGQVLLAKLVEALAGGGNPGLGDPTRLASLRRGVAWLARLNVALGLLVVALGVMLSRM